MLSGLAKQGFLPPLFGNTSKRLPVPLFFLAVATAAMMAAGLAGEPVLEVYIRVGVWLWLLNYAVIHASILVKGARLKYRSSPFFSPAHGVASLASLSLLFIALAALLWTADNTALILKLIVVLLGSVSFLAFMWVYLFTRKERFNSLR